MIPSIETNRFNWQIHHPRRASRPLQIVEYSHHETHIEMYINFHDTPGCVCIISMSFTYTSSVHRHNKNFHRILDEHLKITETKIYTF